MKKIKYNEDNKWVFFASCIFWTLIILLVLAHLTHYCLLKYSDKQVARELSKLTYTEENSKLEINRLKKISTNIFLSSKIRAEINKAATEISYMFGDDALYNSYFAKALYYFKKTKNAEGYVSLLSKYINRLYANGCYTAAKEILDNLNKEYTLSNYSLDNQANYYLTYAEGLQLTNEDSSKYLQTAQQIISQLPIGNKKNLRKAKLDILKARQSILKNDFIIADDILSIYSEDDNFGYSNDYVYVVCDFKIPYYELMTKIYLQQMNFDKSNYYADLYLIYCTNYKFRAMKLNFLKYLINNTDVTQNNFTNKYYKLEKEVEQRYFSEMTNLYGTFLLSDINSIMNDLSLKDTQRGKIIDTVVIMFIVFCALLFGFCIIKVFLIRSNKDGLTQLNNRKKYELMIANCKKKKIPYCFLMIDIDNFKKVNDTYGHAAGDQILRFVSSVIQQYCGRGISAFRYGGEELCLFLLNVSEKRSRKIAEEIRKSIANTKEDNPCSVTVSIGVGISLYGEDVFKEADENLYKAKNNGKNQVV